MPTSPAVPVILNPTAGSGLPDERIGELRKLFAARHVEAEIVVTRSREEALEATRAAIDGGAARIVAAGGDGTVNTVAEAVRETDAALAIVPMGTLNHLARDLGIPLELDKAVETAIGPRRVAVDVGEVNGKSFLNNSSLGIYPDMVRERTKQEHRLGRGRRWATLWATITSLRRFPFMELSLELDDRRHDCRAAFVFIGNNEYVMSGFSIGTRKRLDAGRLSIYTTPRATRPGLVALGLRALFGLLHQSRDFSALQARSVRVRSPHPRLLVATDGEIGYMETPLEYIIRPRSLFVMVPPET